VPAYVFLGLALTLNAFANVLIKYSMSRHPQPILPVHGALASFLTWPYLIGLFCFAANLGCYSMALRTLKISMAYPLMVSLGYLVILLFGWFLFGERLTAVQYVGIGVILLGVWLVVR